MKFWILVCLFSGSGISFAQQQTLFTNFLLHPYLYNPAYAGVIKGTQFNLGHRNQWVGFDGAPQTSTFSGWGNFKKRPHMAVGGMVISDRSGLIQRTNFLGSYAYHLKINKKLTMSFGLSFGGLQYNVKMYDAKPYDQEDVFLTSEILRSFAFDANSGFHLYSKNFFVGASIQQMLNSKIRWDNTSGKLTQHYYAYAGYNFRLDKDSNWVIQPSILARTSFPAPYQLEYHLRVLYKEMIWIGGSFRERSSTSFLLGCNIKKLITLGYAYDYTLTQLSGYSAGSHEIMVSYLIPFKKKKTTSEIMRDADEEELNTIDNSMKTNLKNKKKEEKNKKETEEKKEAPPEEKKPEQEQEVIDEKKPDDGK